MLYASAEECERAFYDAIIHGDTEVMADLWLHDDDICCTHPGGQRLVGFAAVRASWVSILANGAGPQVRPTARRSFESPTLVISNLVEEVLVTDPQGSRLVHVLASNAYTKTPAGWKMIMHLGVVAPMGQALEVGAPMGTVH
jgi:ketosteroid isomerase-like protein